MWLKKNVTLTSDKLSNTPELKRDPSFCLLFWQNWLFHLLFIYLTTASGNTSSSKVLQRLLHLFCKLVSNFCCSVLQDRVDHYFRSPQNHVGNPHMTKLEGVTQKVCHSGHAPQHAAGQHETWRGITSGRELAEGDVAAKGVRPGLGGRGRSGRASGEGEEGGGVFGWRDRRRRLEGEDGRRGRGQRREGWRIERREAWRIQRREGWRGHRGGHRGGQGGASERGGGGDQFRTGVRGRGTWD